MRFIKAIMATNVMKATLDFLVDKKRVKDEDDFKRKLHQIWFELHKDETTCGFEHVFMGEKDQAGNVLGFHGWLYFLLEESKNKLEYSGYDKYVQLSDGKGSILDTRFVKWKDSVKRRISMFIGLSPELEFALYTLGMYAVNTTK